MIPRSSTGIVRNSYRSSAASIVLKYDTTSFVTTPSSIRVRRTLYAPTSRFCSFCVMPVLCGDREEGETREVLVELYTNVETTLSIEVMTTNLIDLCRRITREHEL